MAVLQTIAPTSYFLLVGHFQLSLVLVVVGVRLIRGPRGLSWPSVAVILLSAALFFLVWLQESGGWAIFEGPYVRSEPLVRLLYGPILGVAAPFISRLQSKRLRSGYGILLIAGGIMVATMMILNDLFW